jgi:hypothetical protein
LKSSLVRWEREVLQHVKDVLEQSFGNPNAHDLKHCLRELEQVKATAGQGEKD